jgi:hypothetical protein
MSDARFDPAVFEQKLAKVMANLDSLKSESAGTLNELGKNREKAALRGDLGPEWQKIQQKIDLNKTTIDDVFNGTDESPEAIALRERSEENLSTLKVELETDIEGLDDDEAAVADQLADIRVLNTELAARLEAMRIAMEPRS